MPPINDAAYPTIDLDGNTTVGLTKLEYFAAKALQGTIAHHGSFAPETHVTEAMYAARHALRILEKLDD